jgi:hypothetical protein
MPNGRWGSRIRFIHESILMQHGCICQCIKDTALLALADVVNAADTSALATTLMLKVL